MKTPSTSFRLPPDLKSRLEAVSDATGIPATRIVSVSLERILDAYSEDGPSALMPVRTVPELERAKLLFAETQKKNPDVAATPRQEKSRNK